MNYGVFNAPTLKIFLYQPKMTFIALGYKQYCFFVHSPSLKRNNNSRYEDIGLQIKAKINTNYAESDNCMAQEGKIF